MQSYESWTKKYDPIAYRCWKNILKPILGRSIRRANIAIRRLDGKSYAKNFDDFLKEFRPGEYRPVLCAIRKIEGRLWKFDRHIPLGYLAGLAIAHKRKLLSLKRERRSLGRHRTGAAGK